MSPEATTYALPKRLAALTQPPGEPRPGRCCYCRRDWLRIGDPPDHVLLDSLGARLVTRRACTRCNELLNATLDQPLVATDYLLALERRRRGLRDQRRGGSRSREARHPSARVSLPDGTPVRVDWTSPELVPAQITQEPTGDLIVLGGTAEQRRRLLDDHARKVAERGRGRPVRERQVDRKLRVANAILPVRLWARFVARAALGTVSLLGWDDAWLGGPQARELRDWLFLERPLGHGGTPLTAVPRRPPLWVAPVLRPDEHRLFFVPGRDGRACLHIVLFGKDWFGVIIDPEGRPAPTNAWRMRLGTPPIREDLFDVTGEAFLAATAQWPRMREGTESYS